MGRDHTDQRGRQRSPPARRHSLVRTTRAGLQFPPVQVCKTPRADSDEYRTQSRRVFLVGVRRSRSKATSTSSTSSAHVGRDAAASALGPVEFPVDHAIRDGIFWPSGRRRRIPYPLAYGGEDDSLKLLVVLDIVKSIFPDFDPGQPPQADLNPEFNPGFQPRSLSDLLGQRLPCGVLCPFAVKSGEARVRVGRDCMSENVAADPWLRASQQTTSETRCDDGRGNRRRVLTWQPQHPT